jgi:hypothetical protein
MYILIKALRIGIYLAEKAATALYYGSEISANIGVKLTQKVITMAVKN